MACEDAAGGAWADAEGADSPTAASTATTTDHVRRFMELLPLTAASLPRPADSRR